MSEHARPLPRYLLDRYRSWKAVQFEEAKAWYARLAKEGQRPRAMVISCCDSRTDVVGMFGAEPGDLFVVRNVANIVPPYSADGALHGSSAAIEFACNHLKVADIVVIGHSNCGGIAGCHDLHAGDRPEISGETSFVDRWVAYLKPAYDRIADKADSREERLALLEREGVLESLANLESFPFVRKAIEQEEITLHGAWIDIATGRLEAYDPGVREFLPV